MDRFEKWTAKDFSFKWVWNRGRLQGQENNGYYVIVWKNKGRMADNKHHDYKFRTKEDAKRWLGQFLKKANAIRKQAFVEGRC